VWEDRVYHRADWQGVERYAARRVRDVDGAVVCSLWALGDVVEDHLRLDPDATTVEVIAPRPGDTPPARLSPAVMAGVASAAAALAHLFGDALRTRAQSRVAALSPDAQASLLENGESADRADDARRIAIAVEALVADAGPG